MSPLHMHYVLSTHWDREWYQPFQDYRYRLVQLLDRVIEAIESGVMQGPFTADGQAIMIEDYLEVRPERQELVYRLVQEGKIIVGPWYVLPDLFLLSGESLVRNLRLGRQVARDMGGVPSNAAFACDMFGHNSQMPQIYAGVGLRGGFVWRGINHNAGRLLRWRGADGTELPCYRFGKVGYCSYAYQVRESFDQQRDLGDGKAARNLEQYIQEEAESTPVDTLLLFDGGDHQEFDPEVYQTLMRRMAANSEDQEIVHSSLDAYLEDMLSQIAMVGDVVEGELREPGRDGVQLDNQWLIPGVASSRIDILRANAHCETLLCQWAEPFAALATAKLGREYPQGFLNVAWRWLLKNHPHDSICGCSIDQVHQDMRFRFSQTQQIADRLTTEAAQHLTASVVGEVPEGELRVGVFNPAAQPFEGVAELTFQIPTEWPTFNEFFGFEPKPAFRIHDAQGHELPYQRLGQSMSRIKGRTRDYQFPESFRTNDVRVAVLLRVPALGYTTLTLRREAEGLPTRYADRPSLATGPCTLENEHLALSVSPNGSLSITSKRDGQTYSDLLIFEDCVDIGDGWFHGPPVNDQCYVSSACQAQVALVEDGPKQATLRVRTEMQVPSSFRFEQMQRAEDWVALVIDNYVTLRAGADQVEISSTIYNTAKDHRLRVLFTSGVEADTFVTDTPFDMVERPVALRKDNHRYRELEVEGKPQQGVIAVHDGQRGLAIISPGQYESTVRDLPGRPIALTLLRATRRTVGTDGEPDGQLQGEHTIRYAMVPLGGKPSATGLLRRSQALAAGLRTAHLRPQDMAYYRSAGNLPAEDGLLSLEGQAILTSARQVGGALEVRLLNPETAPSTATLHVQATQVQRVNLESTALGDTAAVENNRLTIAIAPKEVVTLRLS